MIRTRRSWGLVAQGSHTAQGSLASPQWLRGFALGTEVALSGRMTLEDMDRWFVRTDAYLEAVADDPEHPEVHQYVVYPVERARLWPRVVAGLALGVVAFALTAYLI